MASRVIQGTTPDRVRIYVRKEQIGENLEIKKVKGGVEVTGESPLTLKFLEFDLERR